MPGAGPQVVVQAAGRRVADLDGPGRPALAADPDLAALQVQVAAGGIVRVAAIPASSDSRMPVAVNTAMIAASRRAANDRPWQAPCSSDSSTLVNTGTAVTVTLGARSRVIGAGSLFTGPPA